MVDWPTFGNNNQRTGESTDTTISRSNVGSLKLVWAHQNFDGPAQTQPIVVTGVNVGGTSHNIVYVGGGSGTVYAYDAFTGKELWRKSLGQGQYYCGDTPGVASGSPAIFGIMGTPAVDKASSTIYVPDGVHTVHALDLATGAEKWSANAVVAGSDDGSNANLREFLHTGLTFANGKIYGGTGSTCDITPWKGRVFAIDASSHGVSTFFTTFNQGGAYSGGGVWGWGGVSVDPGSGTVFAAAGNADTSPQKAPFAQAPFETAGYGEHVIGLSPSLSVSDANAPSFVEYPAGVTDIDLSGTPVPFQPGGCPPLLAVQGKAGFLFIYNRTKLSAGPIAQFQFSLSSDEPHYTGLPAFSAATGLLYASVTTSVGSYGPGMALISFGLGCSPAVVQQPRFGPDSFNGLSGGYNHGRSTPTYANGVVFIGTPDGVLWARDATSGAALWDSNSAGAWARNPSTDQIRFGPAVTGGWVYVVEADSGSLYALKVPQASASSSLRSTLGTMQQPLPAPAILRPLPKL
jgi:outer membrane protein assembly factor BamB